MENALKMTNCTFLMMSGDSPGPETIEKSLVENGFRGSPQSVRFLDAHYGSLIINTHVLADNQSRRCLAVGIYCGYPCTLFRRKRFLRRSRKLTFSIPFEGGERHRWDELIAKAHSPIDPVGVLVSIAPKSDAETLAKQIESPTALQIVGLDENSSWYIINPDVWCAEQFGELCELLAGESPSDYIVLDPEY